MKKIITLLCIMLCAVMFTVGFAACGEESSGGKTATYTFEAEYTDLEGLVGGGQSTAAYAYDMIQGTGSQQDKDRGWSEGYFIGCTYSKDLTFTFNIKSSEDASGKITLRLGSELGTITLDNTTFGVVINDKELTYSGMTVEGSPSMSEAVFYDKAINSSFDLKKGDNTVKLIVRENNFWGGNQQGGPMIDCIKITTKAELSWTPLTDNPSKKGGI